MNGFVRAPLPGRLASFARLALGARRPARPRSQPPIERARLSTASGPPNGDPVSGYRDPSIEGGTGARSHGAESMPPRRPKAGVPGDEAAADNAAEAPAQGSVSCDKARGIVADFGFKDIRADSCSGKTYGFSATRDGKAFSIKIVAANGERAEVRRQ